jgi:plastocyanin
MRVLAAAILALSVSAVQAADIQGTLVIERKLTRHSVTASIGPYQRGAAVPLATERRGDPLAFERTHVAVWLEGDLPSAPGSASMEQKDRSFVPDFLVVPVGSTVSFPNGDTVFHNVFSLSKPKSFDLGNYSKGQTRVVAFPKPGIVFVNCRLHPNMAGVIVVTPNRWCARGDEAGRFTLRDVPAGTYTVVAWHKAAGFFRARARVSGDSGATVEFLIPLRADGSDMAQR